MIRGMIRLILFFSCPVFAVAVAAASAAAAGGAALPVSTVFAQVLNFGIALGLLFFFVRKPVCSFFLQRAEEFRSHAEKAETARARAEETKRELVHRLKKMEGSSEQDFLSLKKEAEKMKEKILGEAEEVSGRLMKESLRQTQLEYDKTVAKLREELLERSLDLASGRMKSKVDGEDLARLRHEFIRKIQAVL